jgi:hypothetical protein
MLGHEWEDGYLIYQLVLEGTEPAQVAAERGVSRAALERDINHIVAKAKESCKALALEDLTGINARTTIRHDQRQHMNGLGVLPIAHLRGR